MKKHLWMIIAVGLLAGCASTTKDLKSLPDAYFTARSASAMSTEERREYMNRVNKRMLERDRQAACVFGSKAIIDRTKLHCENVKGSPEYKALYDKH
ncbi:hypothetical protein [Salinimonas lutimaris]|uniref:hypothetical protein n=1 Tax=Salinimonas lutimaris TaxID=914153 RepID=UPI0010BF7E43|nr:hypothetical protein [Salinimonas lutimaris]